MNLANVSNLLALLDLADAKFDYRSDAAKYVIQSIPRSSIFQCANSCLDLTDNQIEMMNWIFMELKNDCRQDRLFIDSLIRFIVNNKYKYINPTLTAFAMCTAIDNNDVNSIYISLNRDNRISFADNLIVQITFNEYPVLHKHCQMTF